MDHYSHRRLSRWAVGLGGAILLGLGAGCSAVPLAQQRLVAKPEMGFDLTAHGHPPVNLMSQVEPGLAATAGAQAAGCTSCR
jgi:hypothetical protein